jgi:RNA polymerase sigma-70 factor (ECF subfamily)
MDEASFHDFYEQTAGCLRGYLRSLLDDRNVVDDLFQESYFRLLNADLPATMEPPHRKNYLYRIATNLVQDHRRSRKLESLPEDRMAVTASHSAESNQDIAKALAQLKPREREALWMAYVEGFDHSEIAGVLRMGTASIRPMLFRARSKFAGILRRRGIGH